MTTLPFTQVLFRTEHGSAVGGTNYEDVEVEVVFEPKQMISTVEVTVHPSPIWSPALEFSAQISKASDHARLTTTHLRRCRCWIIHSGMFPSSGSTTSKTFGLSTSRRLMVDFIRTCWSNDVVRKGTIKTLVIDQLPNVHYLMQLMISVFFIFSGL